jgi:hypothetical protein
MPKYLNHHVYKKDLCLYIVYVMTWKMIFPSIRYFKPISWFCCSNKPQYLNLKIFYPKYWKKNKNIIRGGMRNGAIHIEMTTEVFDI